ncbi:MAG: hypothetical protein IPH80_32040 [Myxococcales bacterium]|nr:hypothetical protein [Myxococcales bacterium]
MPILTAFVDGLNPRRAAKAVDRLAALAKSATGVSKALAGDRGAGGGDVGRRAGLPRRQARPGDAKHLATAKRSRCGPAPTSWPTTWPRSISPTAA